MRIVDENLSNKLYFFSKFNLKKDKFLNYKSEILKKKILNSINTLNELIPDSKETLIYNKFKNKKKKKFIKRNIINLNSLKTNSLFTIHKIKKINNNNNIKKTITNNLFHRTHDLKNLSFSLDNNVSILSKKTFEIKNSKIKNLSILSSLNNINKNINNNYSKNINNKSQIIEDKKIQNKTNFHKLNFSNTLIDSIFHNKILTRNFINKSLDNLYENSSMNISKLKKNIKILNDDLSKSHLLNKKIKVKLDKINIDKKSFRQFKKDVKDKNFHARNYSLIFNNKIKSMKNEEENNPNHSIMEKSVADLINFCDDYYKIEDSYFYHKKQTIFNKYPELRKKVRILNKKELDLPKQREKYLKKNSDHMKGELQNIFIIHSNILKKFKDIDYKNIVKKNKIKTYFEDLEKNKVIKLKIKKLKNTFFDEENSNSSTNNNNNNNNDLTI